MTFAYEVYNLEFPSWCDRISAGGYSFLRVPEYRERYQALQHRTSGIGEFERAWNSGSHQVTANVFLPDTEERSIIFQQAPSHSTLDDLLLLLSIFTQRHVFTSWSHDENTKPPKRLNSIPTGAMLTADHRQFPRGGIAIVSLGYEKQQGGTGSHQFFDGALEKGLNTALALLRNEEWQHRYENGQFLLIYREIIAADRPEIAFMLAWTMWEHLFCVQNGMWLSKRTRVTAREKILYVAFRLLGLDESLPLHERIDELVQARNHLVHVGILPDNNDLENDSCRNSVSLFLELTEMLVVQSLKLGEPSNLFNTIERLEVWLKEKK